MRKLLLPEAAAAEWARRHARQHLSWWSQGDAAAPFEGQNASWPQALPLGTPSAAEAADDPAQVRAWVQAWQAWSGPGEVRWEERQWPRMGRQRLPMVLVLPTPEAAAELVGQGARWRRAVDRRQALAVVLPAKAPMPGGARLFEALADWPDADFERLIAVLRWAGEHRASGLYLRQLPVPGLDSKWIEQRRTVVAELAAALPWNATGHVTGGAPGSATGGARDLHTLLGLTRAPTRLRLRVLCATLRRQLGGLGDIEAPRDEVASLPWWPEQVLVVENLESGLALPDLPGTVAFIKLGHAVSLLADIPWLRQAQVRYWGDIDSHGLAILSQARRALPHLQSMLMDRETLLAHQALWVQEPQPWSGAAPEHLTAGERALFDDLAADTWGFHVRLEQERIPWATVLPVLHACAVPQPHPQGASSPAPEERPTSPRPGARQPPGAGMEARQLDIFADSGDVIRRNAFADAVLAENLPQARTALQAWQAEWPDDRLLAPAAHLLAHLQAAGDAQASSGLPATGVAAAADALEVDVGPAAAALLGDGASAWLATQWCALAARARHVAWHAELARAHPAALFLRGGQWNSAAQAVASIPSWRRIPQPLLWMAEARWHDEGADVAWPLLAEAFWLAPARAHALLESLASHRLRQAMERFESDFELQDGDDWAWWPAWLAVDQPLLAEVLGLGEDAPDNTAATGFRLVASLLRLEREGRHHELVAARKGLQSLEPRLFACYMRTR